MSARREDQSVSDGEFTLIDCLLFRLMNLDGGLFCARVIYGFLDEFMSDVEKFMSFLCGLCVS